jgi:tRNA threonylcarbamoyl adenosine modification protein (Sua5/YciO/YrdC/YwlC family)
MSTFEHIRMHPERPQIRHIRRVAELLEKGYFAVVPTETTYGIMMLCNAYGAQQAVRTLRQLDERHLWSLVCHDLPQASQFVKIDNHNHRILKRHLPGPFTFVLPVNSQLHRRVLNKRKDIGIRMPDHPVCDMLLQELRQPLLATSVIFPGESEIAIDPDVIIARIKHLNAVMLDVGWCGAEPTTVVDLNDDVEQRVLRPGLGIWPID